MIILILDYGSGNLQSVYNSVKTTLDINDIKSKISVSNNLKDIENSDKIILPGVGSFNHCIKNLSNNFGVLDQIKEMVFIKSKPLLGICVGMQMFANLGYENKKTKGLNFIEGEVKSIKNFVKTNKNLKIPHMGWNNLVYKKKHQILDKISEHDYFYFVHSYFFQEKNKEDVIATTNHGIEMASIISKDNIFGFQFHPEKSGKSGLKILNNWLTLD